MLVTLAQNEESIEKVFGFYQKNAPKGLRYPRNLDWIKVNNLRDIFLITVNEPELVGVAWVAKKPLHVFLELHDNRLYCRTQDGFTDSGGWLVAESAKHKGHMTTLAHAVHDLCHNHLQTGSFWGRMVGVGSEKKGVPLFWDRLGSKLTGHDYHDLLSLPFGQSEIVLANSWPTSGLKLKDIPSDVLGTALGATTTELQKAEAVLSRLGIRRKEGWYVPTSLNEYIWSDIHSYQETFPDGISILK